MVWADTQKESMTDLYNDWINNDKNLIAARFVQIRDTKGDTLKLQEIEASDEEVIAF